MTGFFVDHFKRQNPLQAFDANLGMILISAVLVLLFFLTLRREEEGAGIRDEFLAIETGDMLRGLAIVFLLFGHLAMTCAYGDCLFEGAGTWAVTIFLFISGVALTKTYGWVGLENTFFWRRLRKLLPSNWIVLIAFYTLDFALRNKTYGSTKILLDLLGASTPNPPNGPNWFIAYILYLYLIYYLVSKIRMPNAGRVLLLFLLSYGTMLLILTSTFLSANVGIWTQYAIVFPTSVAIGIYSKAVKDGLNHLFRKKRIVYWAAIFASLSLFISGKGLYTISHLIDSPIYAEMVVTLRSVPFIIALLMLSHLVDMFRIYSKSIAWLGQYSFEIFLIHLPFMVYYDFFFFRKPLYLFFIFYLILIFTLSFLLKKAAASLDRLFFGRKILPDVALRADAEAPAASLLRRR